MRTSAPLLALLLLLAPSSGTVTGMLEAQSVLDRTPNLSGGWVGSPGQIHFNFLHRFHLVDGGDESIVVNTPSFLLAAPVSGSTLLGVRYASSSGVAPGDQNEWELMGRWAPLDGGRDDPLDLSLTTAYNTAASSVDGEVQIGVPVGPVRLLGIGRAFSDQRGAGDAGWAAGGGAVYRISDGFAVAGDIVSASDRPDSRTVAWGAGVQVRIPLTPHTLSLQAANTRTATLQGSSDGFRERGGDGDQQIFWGFEFTIPFTLSRYFGGDDRQAARPRGAEDAGDRSAGAGTAGNRGDRRATAASGAPHITMTRNLRYMPETIRIEAGTTVTWENTTALLHTVTADPERADDPSHVSLPGGSETFASGDLRPGERFSHTFSVPGEYVYFCVPHEAAGMVGRVIVSD